MHGYCPRQQPRPVRRFEVRPHHAGGFVIRSSECEHLAGRLRHSTARAAVAHLRTIFPGERVSIAVHAPDGRLWRMVASGDAEGGT